MDSKSYLGNPNLKAANQKIRFTKKQVRELVLNETLNYSSINKNDDDFNSHLNKVYDKFSNNLVKKIKKASNNGKDEKAKSDALDRAGNNGNITTIGQADGGDVDLIANNTDLDVEALGSVVGFTQAAAKPVAGLAAGVDVFLQHVNGGQGAANAQVKVSLLVESVA